MYAGKNAGLQYSQAQLYDPTAANGRCGDQAVIYRCLQLNGTGDGVNDVLQYWLGSYLVNLNAGRGDDGSIFDAFGTDTPFDGVDPWSFNGADSAQNQDTANSFIATSGILPAGEYPQFDSWVAAKYDRPGGPFDPHDGTKLRLLADRGPVVQATHAHGERACGRSRHVLLGLVQHRAGLGHGLR
jgi:hypothetical protein